MSIQINLAQGIKNIIARMVPAPVAHRIKKWYYPRMLRNFTPAKWPSSGVAQKLVIPGEYVIDAGANIGYVSLLLSRWVGPGGRVFSFEPVPRTFDLLQNNIRALKLENVKVFNFGVSNHSGHASMTIPDYATGGKNYYEAAITGQEGTPGSFDVELCAMDNVIPQDEKRIAFIKIDVEGHEWNAIQGTKEIIRRHHPSLMIEVMGDPDEEGSNAEKLFTYLAGEGYKVFIQEDDALVERNPGRHATDYFFVYED